MATQERDPRPYELMTIFIPELSEEDNQAQIERVEGYITNAGGSMTETLTSSPWGRRRLAYTMRFNSVDYRDGYYTVYHFDSSPSLLTELERDLKLDTSVMRYLLVHDDPKAGEKFPEGAEGEAEGGVTEGAETAATAVASASSAATTEAPSADPEAPAAETDTEPAATETSTGEATPVEETTAEAPAETVAAESSETPTDETSTEDAADAPSDDATTDKE